MTESDFNKRLKTLSLIALKVIIKGTGLKTKSELLLWKFYIEGKSYYEIANDISGAYISIENYGIKREDLKSYSDFNEAQKQYGNKVYEQARYYARKEKFLDYY